LTYQLIFNYNLVYENHLKEFTADFKFGQSAGDQLRLEVTTIRMLSTGGFVMTKAFVGEKLVAEAEIGFGIKENV
jgi:3-hydroxymyristoyl/3-hydroxydecanoyl-(acyl carrier protein) dehydratase